MINLLNPEDIEEMLKNGAQSAHGMDIDPRPVVKIFTPDKSAKWLLSELDVNDPDLAFGLCDLGHGSPELGYVRISEISDLRGPLGLAPERDPNFNPRMPLSSYARIARAEGQIND